LGNDRFTRSWTRDPRPTGGNADKPGVTQGQIQIREVLSLTLTFDHDVVDGAPAARFTSRLKELIESRPNPFDQEM